MVTQNLVGRCGLYCGACGIYRAYKNGGAYRRRLAENFKCAPETVRCEGCQALTSECWGNACTIIRCLNENGFQFCYECADFLNHSCEQFEKLAKSSSEYDEDLRANLARIQADDVDSWLQECEVKFRCAYCGEPLPARSLKKQCYHCGKDLASE
jgi:hypothetical protein